MCEIRGCFFIRNEGNGCLTSVYLEHSSERPMTESCILESIQEEDPFVGTFRTSWLEPGNRTGTLRIDPDGVVYDLTWTGFSQNGQEYRGRAMLSEGKLIGCYWLEDNPS